MSFSDIRKVNDRKQIISPFAFHHIMNLDLVIIELQVFFCFSCEIATTVSSNFLILSSNVHFEDSLLSVEECLCLA